MAISVAESSLVVNDVPVVAAPYVNGNTAYFEVSLITATGTAKLVGGAGDSLDGWQLGFIQVEFVETNWAYYRGRTPADGSLLLQFGRGRARPRQAYRDTEGDLTSPNDVFYDSYHLVSDYVGGPGVGTAASGASPPVVLTARHADKPGNAFDATRTHGQTRLYLREAQLEFLFFAVLSLRDPAGNYHHLKSFYWNTRWQATFSPSTFSLSACPMWSVVPTGGGNGASVSKVIDGPPNDPRVEGVLTSPQSMNANQAADYESHHVVETYSPTWRSFDVTR